MKFASHRIAVIADTHGRLPLHLIDKIRDADEIWHLGDFCNLDTLSACRAIGRPFLAVLGNNDYGLDLPETLELERAGKWFHLVHIPPRRMPACDVLLHGTPMCLAMKKSVAVGFSIPARWASQIKARRQVGGGLRSECVVGCVGR